MSDYTPTTEEVYRRFWRGTPLRSEDKLREYVALDRWLAEVKAQAWEVGYKSAERNIAFPDRYVLDVNPYRQGEEQ